MVGGLNRRAAVQVPPQDYGIDLLADAQSSALFGRGHESHQGDQYISSADFTLRPSELALGVVLWLKRTPSHTPTVVSSPRGRHASLLTRFATTVLLWYSHVHASRVQTLTSQFPRPQIEDLGAHPLSSNDHRVRCTASFRTHANESAC